MVVIVDVLIIKKASFIASEDFEKFVRFSDFGVNICGWANGFGCVVKADAHVFINKSAGLSF